MEIKNILIELCEEALKSNLPDKELYYKFHSYTWLSVSCGYYWDYYADILTGLHDNSPDIKDKIYTFLMVMRRGLE